MGVGREHSIRTNATLHVPGHEETGSQEPVLVEIITWNNHTSPRVRTPCHCPLPLRSVPPTSFKRPLLTRRLSSGWSSLELSCLPPPLSSDTRSSSRPTVLSTLSSSSSSNS